MRRKLDLRWLSPVLLAALSTACTAPVGGAAVEIDSARDLAVVAPESVGVSAARLDRLEGAGGPCEIRRSRAYRGRRHLFPLARGRFLMLADKDRIFTNVYGFQDWGLKAAQQRGEHSPANSPLRKRGNAANAMGHTASQAARGRSFQSVTDKSLMMSPPRLRHPWPNR